MIEYDKRPLYYEEPLLLALKDPLGKGRFSKE